MRALRHALNVLAGQRAKVGTSYQVLEFLVATHGADGAFLDGVHAGESVVFVQGLVLVCGKGREKGWGEKKEMEKRVNFKHGELCEP